MSTYLIDFENVKSGGLTGIDAICREDSVHLFWSTRENKISIEMMELIRRSESEIVMHKAVTGERDALDHQLCSYLGFLAGAQGETDFVIVSNDKAYDHLIEFWKNVSDVVKILRVSDIGKAVELLRRQEAAKEAAKRAAEKAAVKMAEQTAEKAAVKTTEQTVEKAAVKTAEQTAVKEKMEHSAKEAAPVLETAVEKTENAVKETAAEEPRHGRNARRRERGGRYLKNGRQGRGERRNSYIEESAPAQIKEQHIAYEAEVKPAEPVESAEEKSVISPAAYVVSGITSGILVESGFTADGILDKKEEKKPEPVQKKKKPAVKEVKAVTEKAESVKAEAKPAEEVESVKAEIKPAEEAEPVKAEVKPSEEAEPVKAEVKPAAEAEPVKAEVKPSEEAEPVKAETKPAEEAKPMKEELSAVSQKAAESETPVNEETGLETEVSVKETFSEVSEQEETVSESENPLEEKLEKTEKKTRTRASKAAGRTKKSRTAKIKEHTPKAPATAADVEEKCEEAAHAEWTADVVRLINESKDLKELYASIVKLLGQENGRKVYRAIKVLK